jgi:hypothetical protein
MNLLSGSVNILKQKKYKKLISSHKNVGLMQNRKVFAKI